MSPTPSQLSSFYLLVREIVLLSLVVTFVELAMDSNVYVYASRQESVDILVFRIATNGEYRLWPTN